MPPSASAPPLSPETLETPTATASDESGASTASALVPVTAQPTDLAPLPDDGFAQTVPFKALDLRINRSKGQFWLDGDPEPREELYVIPRGAHRAQQFYGLPYNPKEPHEPSCYSPDGVHGHGWIDVADQTDAPRSCAGCPRKGFGAGYCTDNMVMLAYDIAKQTPVILRFQNAELNPRRGVLTLAVNRWRLMGLKPTQALMKMSFAETEGAYKNLVLDVAPLEGNTSLSADELADVTAMLDVCWSSYEEARAYEVQAIS